MGFQHFFCIPGWFIIGANFLVKLLLQVHDYNKETLLYSRGWSRLIIRGTQLMQITAKNAVSVQMMFQ